MEQNTCIREKCRTFVQIHSAGFDGSHDISHIDRVTTNAIKILALSSSEYPHVNEDILIAIASLHDSFDHKYLTTPESVEIAKAEVREFLITLCGFDANTIEMIIQVIDTMGFTSEITLGKCEVDPTMNAYLHIVQDADRLDAIGAIGVARCLTFSGAFGRPIISADGLEEQAQMKKYISGELHATSRKGPSAISHFYDKLLFLKDMLKTRAGKQLGEKRHAFLLAFLAEFFDEIM